MANLHHFFSLKRNRAAWRGLVRKLKRRQGGVAAVEFAFILPIMVTLFFGLIEVSQGIMIDRKTTLLNRTLADLASQANAAVDNTERDNIFNAALATLAPFPANNVGMIIYSVVVNSAGVAKVCWVDSYLGRMAIETAVGSTFPYVPAGLDTPSTSFIAAKSSYAYTPTVGYVLTGTINLGGSYIYMRPRQGKSGPTGIEQIERSGIAAPTC